MKADEVVEAFIAHLGDNGYPGLRIDRRPDAENRQSKDIDAIAGQFAIEHTFISTFQEQKTQDDWFKKAMSGLEQELPAPPYQLNIISGFYDIQKRQDCQSIRNAFKTWIAKEADQLADGGYTRQLPGIPFQFRVEKLSNATPGIFFIRHLPGNNDSLPLRIHEHLTSKEKIEKLIPYKKRGLTTILLIEGLLSPNKMRAAIQGAFPDGLLPPIDEVWYVSTWGNEADNFTKLRKCVANQK